MKVDTGENIVAPLNISTLEGKHLRGKFLDESQRVTESVLI